ERTSLRILDDAPCKAKGSQGLVGGNKAQQRDVEAERGEIGKNGHPRDDVGVDAIGFGADDSGDQKLRAGGYAGAGNIAHERGGAPESDSLDSRTAKGLVKHSQRPLTSDSLGGSAVWTERTLGEPSRG